MVTRQNKKKERERDGASVNVDLTAKFCCYLLLKWWRWDKTPATTFNLFPAHPTPRGEYCNISIPASSEKRMSFFVQNTLYIAFPTHPSLFRTFSTLSFQRILLCSEHTVRCLSNLSYFVQNTLYIVFPTYPSLFRTHCTLPFQRILICSEHTVHCLSNVSYFFQNTLYIVFPTYSIAGAEFHYINKAEHQIIIAATPKTL